MNARTKAAFGYRERGWHPFPVRPDKRPAWHLLELARGTNAVSSFQKEPATDAELGVFWERDPNSGVAIILEPGHFVYDIDDPNADDVLDIPTTFRVGTRRGHHHHLRSDAPLRHVRFGYGELRNVGDICVMPPTPGYHLDVDVAELAELPESLVRLARARACGVGEGALVSWVYFTWASPNHRDTQEDVSLRLLRAMGGPENASLGRNFRCVLHDDRHASAELYRLRDGTIAYHCFGPCGWMSLPLVHARQSGRQGRIGRVETMLWRLSLLERAGLVEGVDLAAPEVPFPLTNIWRGFLRLLSLRWLTTPRLPTPFSRRFGAAWCGVSEAEIRVGFAELRQLGFVVYAGRDPRGLALWLPCEEVMPLAD